MATRVRDQKECWVERGVARGGGRWKWMGTLIDIFVLIH